MSIYAFGFTILLAGYAVSAQLTSPVRPERLADIIIAHLPVMKERLVTADTLRDQIVAHSGVLDQARSLNPLVLKIAKESALASMPMINPRRLNEVDARRFSAGEILFAMYSQEDGSPANLVGVKGLSERVSAAEKAYASVTWPEISDSYLQYVHRSLLMADPIVRFLLRQAPGTISHERVLQFATEIFDGDAVTAVAFLGELFYQETLRVQKLRTREAVLAAKMQPVIDQDPNHAAGHNYHLWKIIAASLYRRSTILGRLYGRLDNTLPSYRQANQLGFDIADLAIKAVDAQLIRH